MRWKAFITPLNHVDAETARAWLAGDEGRELSVLDVRQPHEYASGHLPGAQLIPLAELPRRHGELDASRPTLVYCAAGMRSMAGAQFLAGQGFAKVFNLRGGTKAWEGRVAYGDAELGLHLLPADMPLESALAVAYGMEKGLCDFYLGLRERVSGEGARQLFSELSAFEVEHADAVWEAWRRVSERDLSREDFEREVVGPELEGGLTGEEYLEAFGVDLENEIEVLSLAMQIEAQAMDLYGRAARRCESAELRAALEAAALEERGHLERLGALLDERAAGA